MKEMVGGCCVCSDERGWPENPLVYCDGQGCTVAVHQACYGIVTVPTGPWYCRKCESQERAARVRCELCPSRDGALKKTDNMGWAHVVCALYIPEVRFGNVTTMEPIILQLIPQERYNKTCYICTELGKGNRASAGACMQCNKAGCKQQFHVTCAQQLGLLCEEAGNYLDNVKYCGYCQHHYSKLKKGGNVKPIPPYKPISHAENSSDAPSSPEKELESSKGSLSRQSELSSKQRKSSSASKSSTAVGASSSQITSAQSSSNSSTSSHLSTTTTSSSSGFGSNKGTSSSSTSSKDKEKHNKSTSKLTNSTKSHDKDLSISSSSASSSKSKSSKNNSSSSSSSKDDQMTTTSTSHKSGQDMKPEKPISTQTNPIVQPARLNAVSPLNMGTVIKQDSSKHMTDSTSSLPPHTKDTFGPKFTTSNFTETIIVNSDSVFGSDAKPATGAVASNPGSSTSSGSKKRKSDGRITSGTNIDEINKDIIKDVSVTLVPLQGYDKLEAADAEKSIKKFCISQPKAESTSAIVTSSASTSSEPNLQNLSPNIVSSKQQQQVIQNVQSNNNNTSTTSSKQSSHVKDHFSSGYQGVASSQPSTPSLVVSVPLSTANVPGVNLNLTSNSNSSNHNNPPPQLQSQQGHSGNTYQSHRNDPHVNISTSQSHYQQPPQQQQQQQQGAGMIERQSPLMQHRTSSPAVHAISPIDHGPVHSGSTSALHGSTMEAQSNSTMLKITYEKQPNSRVSALQEEETASGRRSRSHSIDGGGGGGSSSSKNKGRSSKKRGANANLATEAAESAVITGLNMTNNSTSGHNMSVLANNNNNNMSSSDSMSASASTNMPIHSSSTNSSSSDLANMSSSVSHPPSKMRRMSTIESTSPPSTSRTPEVIYSSNSSSGFSGLKFGYESQTPTASNTAHHHPTVVITQPTIKDSPPSSPGSENGVKKPTKKQKTGATTSSVSPIESKENKLFQNGVAHAAHMLGNQLNPNSSMAPKLAESLNMEIEAHLQNTAPAIEHIPHVGPTYPGKIQSSRSSVLATQGGTQSLSSLIAGSTTATGNTPQSLEQLLERQWEQGSQFLMEQAQHFDIASLLSCLHQLKSENIRLEEHVSSLVARRDHLLAVNARLAIPLNPPVPQSGHFNNMHPTVNGPTDATTITLTGGTGNTSSSASSRQRSSNQSQSSQQQQPPSSQQQTQQPPQQYSTGHIAQIPLENGIDFRHAPAASHQSGHSTSSNPSIVRHSGGNQAYTSSSSSRTGSMGRGSSGNISYSSQQPVYSSHQATLRRDDVKPS